MYGLWKRRREFRFTFSNQFYDWEMPDLSSKSPQQEENMAETYQMAENWVIMEASPFTEGLAKLHFFLPVWSHWRAIVVESCRAYLKKQKTNQFWLHHLMFGERRSWFQVYTSIKWYKKLISIKIQEKNLQNFIMKLSTCLLFSFHLELPTIFNMSCMMLSSFHST